MKSSIIIIIIEESPVVLPQSSHQHELGAVCSTEWRRLFEIVRTAIVALLLQSHNNTRNNNVLNFSILSLLLATI